MKVSSSFRIYRIQQNLEGFEAIPMGETRVRISSSAILTKQCKLTIFCNTILLFIKIGTSDNRYTTFNQDFPVFHCQISQHPSSLGHDKAVLIVDIRHVLLETFHLNQMLIVKLEYFPSLISNLLDQVGDDFIDWNRPSSLNLQNWHRWQFMLKSRHFSVLQLFISNLFSSLLGRKRTFSLSVRHFHVEIKNYLNSWNFRISVEKILV